jgi:hypothetical protein
MDQECGYTEKDPNLASVCRITVESPHVRTVPINDLVACDKAVWGCSAGLKSRDERLGHVKPGIMRPCGIDSETMPTLDK